MGDVRYMGIRYRSSRVESSSHLHCLNELVGVLRVARVPGAVAPGHHNLLEQCGGRAVEAGDLQGVAHGGGLCTYVRTQVYAAINQLVDGR